jgi:hypothetical protein
MRYRRFMGETVRTEKRRGRSECEASRADVEPNWSDASRATTEQGLTPSHSQGDDHQVVCEGMHLLGRVIDDFSKPLWFWRGS